MFRGHATYHARGSSLDSGRVPKALGGTPDVFSKKGLAAGVQSIASNRRSRTTTRSRTIRLSSSIGTLGSPPATSDPL